MFYIPYNVYHIRIRTTFYYLEYQNFGNLLIVSG